MAWEVADSQMSLATRGLAAEHIEVPRNELSGRVDWAKSLPKTFRPHPRPSGGYRAELTPEALANCELRSNRSSVKTETWSTLDLQRCHPDLSSLSHSRLRSFKYGEECRQGTSYRHRGSIMLSASIPPLTILELIIWEPWDIVDVLEKKQEVTIVPHPEMLSTLFKKK